MYRDATPIFSSSDKYVVRFRVKPLALLSPELAIPVGDLWDELSRTKKLDRSQPGWIARAGLMSSLGKLATKDGALLRERINAQLTHPRGYELTAHEAQVLARETR